MCASLPIYGPLIQRVSPSITNLLGRHKGSSKGSKLGHGSSQPILPLGATTGESQLPPYRKMNEYSPDEVNLESQRLDPHKGLIPPLQS